jgi:hypothetical protein
LRTASIGLILRPACGDAEKSGESRNVDECFDPLHGASKRRANIGSGIACWSHPDAASRQRESGGRAWRLSLDGVGFAAWSIVMNPELIQTMRAALEAVMARVPAEQSVFGLKAAMAEVILKAAAHGHTSFDSLVASASNQIQSVISVLS